MPLPSYGALQLAPGERAEMGARISNCGYMKFRGHQVVRTEGAIGPAQQTAPEIAPNDSANIWLPVTAPIEPGCYRSTYRLQNGGGFFGEAFTILISVHPTGVAAEAAIFVEHLSIPDNTTIGTGQSFTKGMRINNCGEIAWLDHVLTRVSGTLGPERIEVPLTQAGQDVRLWIPMVAPQMPGTYRVGYQLEGPRGKFGPVFYVEIKAR